MSFRRLFCGCLCSCLVIPLVGPALWAQASSLRQSSSGQSSSSKPVRRSPSKADVPPDSGNVKAGVYRNAGFGFSCKIPSGWVLRTEEMNSPDAEESQTAPDSGQAQRVLLAAFSRPPAARGEDVNSSILIAAESAAAYPGLKDAAQYFGPVMEIA